MTVNTREKPRVLERERGERCCLSSAFWQKPATLLRFALHQVSSTALQTLQSKLKVQDPQCHYKHQVQATEFLL